MNGINLRKNIGQRILAYGYEANDNYEFIRSYQIFLKVIRASVLKTHYPLPPILKLSGYKF